MEYNTKISPLMKDLKDLGVAEYLKSSAYERFLVKKELDQLWKQYYDNLKNNRYGFILGFDMTSAFCEDALTILLDELYNKENKQGFYDFIFDFLKSFVRFKDVIVDLSEIIADIEILPNSQSIVNQLNELRGSLPREKRESLGNIEKEDFKHGLVSESKLFISHATKDAEYVEKLVNLLELMGLKKEHIFCSSIADYGIPMGCNIYDYLKRQFQEKDLYVIFVLSDSYYKSAACLNEMGAAWVLQSHYQMILLPNFTFENVKGAIDTNKISYRLDDKKERRTRTNELKDNILTWLELESLDSDVWERHRESFFDNIDKIANS